METINKMETIDKEVYEIKKDGIVYSRDRKTDVSPDKLSDFLAIAKELGFITGKL